MAPGSADLSPNLGRGYYGSMFLVFIIVVVELVFAVEGGLLGAAYLVAGEGKGLVVELDTSVDTVLLHPLAEPERAFHHCCGYRESVLHHLIRGEKRINGRIFCFRSATDVLPVLAVVGLVEDIGLHGIDLQERE